MTHQLSPSPKSTPARRRRDLGGRADCRDRGAVLVEAAIVTPLLLLLVFGVFEMGMLFRDYLGTTASVGAGARSASIAANDPRSDWFVLQSMKRTSAALPEGSIKRIVVFNAGGTVNGLPVNFDQCKNGFSQPGQCNVYEPSDWDVYDAAKFECDGAPDPAWCGNSRLSSDSSPTYIGVWMLVEHNYITGMFGDSLDLTTKTVYRIEPTGI